MSTNDANQGGPPEAERSHSGLLIIASIIALGITWTYLLFGKSGLGIWAKAGATVVFIGFIFGLWRWRRKREQQQLDVLQRWAAADEGAAKRPKPRR